jgi:hypothetical protein
MDLLVESDQLKHQEHLGRQEETTGAVRGFKDDVPQGQLIHDLLLLYCCVFQVL